MRATLMKMTLILSAAETRFTMAGVAGPVLFFVILLGFVGLVVGYLIFGRVGGEYLAVKQLFQPVKNIIEDIARNGAGIQDARRNIWISGAVGAGLGLIVSMLNDRRR